MKKIIYACQMPDGRFWDGDTPYRVQTNWVPRTTTKPKGLGREVTLKRKMAQYAKLRQANPELPPVTPLEVEVEMTFRAIPLDYSAQSKSLKIVEKLFADKHSGDILLDCLSSDLTRDFEYVYDRLDGHDYVTKRIETDWKINDPEALWGKHFMFMKQDGAMMFRIAHPEQRLFDLRKLLE